MSTGTNSQTMNLFGDELSGAPKTTIPVVELTFVRPLETDWMALFSDFKSLRAITYSSSISFMANLIGLFDEVEIILGSDKLVHGNLEEIIAYQQETTQAIQDMVSTKGNELLLQKIRKGQLRFHISRELMSHEKLYILDGPEKRRVILGSANMSRSAFTGLQRENICFMDGDAGFEHYLGEFESFKSRCTDSVDKKCFMNTSPESMDDVPLFDTVRVRNLVLVEASLNPEAQTEVEFSLRVATRAKRLTAVVPKLEKGRIRLTPEVISTIRRKCKLMNEQVAAATPELPKLVIDIENGQASLNDKMLDLSPDEADVALDVACFIEYIEGFRRFHGDTEDLVRKYFAFTNWLFVSPFMATMRDFAHRNNCNVYPYPVFGLLYGKSKGGKTSFLETLLKLMIGQKLTLAADKFTRTNIAELRSQVKGVPIVIDDLTQQRFNQHGYEIIKNESFGLDTGNRHYPAVVISANEDVNVVMPEIGRRTVTCHIQAGLTNMEIMKNSTVQKIQRTIGTAFYRRYLGEMLLRVPRLLSQIKEEGEVEPPDILNESSVVLQELIQTYTSETAPSWVRILTLDDYFNEQVTRKALIEQVKRDWDVNRKSFRIISKANELRYDTNDNHAARRLHKELPEDLLAKVLQTTVVMDLKKATSFFGIRFFKRWRPFGL